MPRLNGALFIVLSNVLRAEKNLGGFMFFERSLCEPPDSVLMKPFPKISRAFREALCAFFCLMLGFSGLVASASAQDPPVAAGETDRGRAIFNGIGGCFNCHGNDGVITRLPRHSPQLAEELARLTPPPADLRNPSRLKSQTDADRLRSIKFGHPGTAMFPKKFLSEREVADLLAYLATLREEAGGSDKAAP